MKLLFAHANSFPSSIYRKLHQRLAEHGYEVGYLDTIGHDAAYPVTDCWPQLADEMLAYMAANYREPVLAVGHSLGGAVLFLAALREPQRFRQLIVLDSPLLGPRTGFLIWLAKRLGFIQQLTPGGTGTLRRRDNWASTTSVYDYFARKPAFARWDPDCLHDYAQYGTEDNGDGGRRLKFRPQVEHAIYETLPHDAWFKRGKLQVPLSYVAAGQGSAIRPHDLAFMHRHFAADIHVQRGSHLFPLEHPLETADLIARLAGGAARATAA
ncbi:alpha/beta fold hydrolase [Vogesella sp. LIG4]|uniref:alpha/beta fold hydrolase n=1 Tax=Vogesella sp. LIG4 TaxID=1192162 RepID=UPI00081FA374|nr:alpha/beta hydrolase [Vogesella sp. LIG4]SCK22134.1 Pimeloyl-ACP methyl ester carboxylesterase [Vogesella sp. LIG4]